MGRSKVRKGDTVIVQTRDPDKAHLNGLRTTVKDVDDWRGTVKLEGSKEIWSQDEVSGTGQR